VWVWLHDEALSTSRRPAGQPGGLSLKNLVQVAEEELGTIDMIASERPLE
jgi:hypothetical protein